MPQGPSIGLGHGLGPLVSKTYHGEHSASERGYVRNDSAQQFCRGDSHCSSASTHSHPTPPRTNTTAHSRKALRCDTRRELRVSRAPQRRQMRRGRRAKRWSIEQLGVHHCAPPPPPPNTHAHPHRTRNVRLTTTVRPRPARFWSAPWAGFWAPPLSTYSRTRNFSACLYPGSFTSSGV